MRILIPLSSSVLRWSWAGFALICFGGMAGIALLYFVISVVANPRTPVDLPTVESAVSYFPRSARLHARLAAKLVENGSRATESHEAMANRAFQHALQAVQLAPDNYQYRMLLAAASELRGETAMAESSLRESVKLAPSDINVRWQLANLYLRLGKVEDAVREFRVVTAADQIRLPAIMSLIWQATNKDLEMLDRTIGSAPQTRLALARFLLEQAQADASARVFGQIDRESRLKMPESGQYFDALLRAGQWRLAGALWRETVTGPTGNPPELFWNGGFDQPAPKALAHFDWQISHSNYARLQIASGRAHSGQHALAVAFQGKETTRLDGEVKHPVLVEPGTAYRLEFFARAEDLVTPDGPEIAILRVDNRAVIASSAPVAAGTSDWQMMTIDFTAPADAQAVLVAIKQTPRYNYVEPTSGVVRFDDFSLKAQ